MSYQDIPALSTEEAQELFRSRYRHLRFLGKGHDELRRIRHLYRNTGPNPHRLCPIEGIWAAEQLLAGDRAIDTVVLCPERIRTAHAQTLVDELAKRTKRFFAVSGRVFDTISEDPSAAGLLLLFPLPLVPLEEIPLKPQMRLIVMDGVEIQGNAGTILRSADATGFDAAVFTNRKIRLNHPKLVRASMGSVLSVPVVEADVHALADWLHANDFQILLADTDSASDFHRIAYADRCAIVVGSEKYGLAQEWYSVHADRVKIPMNGRVDSLNVAIAATVLMVESVYHKNNAPA